MTSGFPHKDSVMWKGSPYHNVSMTFFNIYAFLWITSTVSTVTTESVIHNINLRQLNIWTGAAICSWARKSVVLIKSVHRNICYLKIWWTREETINNPISFIVVPQWFTFRWSLPVIILCIIGPSHSIGGHTSRDFNHTERQVCTRWRNWILKRQGISPCLDD